MKSTFFAKLNDDSTMKKVADRMEIVDDAIRVFNDGQLVAYADLGIVLYAHITSQEAEKEWLT